MSFASIPLRLVCTDFDGTFSMPAEQGAFDPAFFERLAHWRREGPLMWVVNTSRDWQSLQIELWERDAPVWPDWVVLVEREIWLVKDRRPVGWFEWNRKGELLHKQLFASVTPMWNMVGEFIRSETSAQIVGDAASPMALLASDDEEADRICAHIEPMLSQWPNLALVRNGISLRFSHALYNKGTCLRAVARGLGIQPFETLVIGDDHNDLPMLTAEHAAHLGCPANAVPEVKQRVLGHRGYVADREGLAGVVDVFDALFPHAL